MDNRSRLYVGDVIHHRLKPKAHRFRYSVFSMLVNLDELPDLHRKLRLFSHNGWNIFSFLNRDHGPRDGRDLRGWVETEAEKSSVNLEGGAILVLCYPRMFGYVFNPLTVYFCHDKTGHLSCILYEVSNTFGEKHTYVIPVKSMTGNRVEQSCDKQFYVSPFLPISGRYAFKVTPPEDEVAVVINHDNDDGPVLNAWFTGARAPLSDRRLARLLITHPLMTFKVIIGIHWEALRLWRKGVSIFRRHPAPASPATFVNN
jgi:DUF1365 family protein